MLMKRIKIPLSIHDEKKASNPPLSYKTIYSYMNSNHCLIDFIIRKSGGLGSVVLFSFYVSKTDWFPML